MTAIPQNTNQSNRWTRYLESLAITNQAGGAGVVAANKYIRVPHDATHMLFLLFAQSLTGTTPILNFEVNVPDISTEAKRFAPDDANVGPLGGFTFVPITGAGPYLQQVHFGPGLVLAQTGAAAADYSYTVPCVLPPLVSYRLLVDGATGDEDYTAQLVVEFSR